MYHLRYLAVEASAAILFFPLYYYLNRHLIRNARKSWAFCLLSCYLAAVYALVGLPNVTYIRFEPNLQLIPLVGILGDLKNSILNIALFVPLGVFLPLLVKKCRSLSVTFRWGVTISLIIEVLQIFSGRATDVNDILTNALGTVIGFLLAYILPSSRLCIHSTRREISGVFALSFFVMFFMQPFLTKLIWFLL